MREYPWSWNLQAIQILQLLGDLDRLSRLYQGTLIGTWSRHFVDIVLQLLWFSIEAVGGRCANDFFIAVWMLVLSWAEIELFALAVVPGGFREWPNWRLIFEVGIMLVVAWPWSLVHDQRIPQILTNYTSNVRVHFLLGLITPWAWNTTISIHH
jgi:hypothetical protein